MVDVVREIGKIGSDVRWVGAVSFEERCIGSLVALGAAGVRVRSALLVDYFEGARIDEDAAAQRLQLEEEQLALLASLACRDVQRVPLPAYSFSSFEAFCMRSIADVEAAPIIFDISCFTRAHVLALARSVVQVTGGRVLAAYTAPETYGFSSVERKRTSEWKDVLIAPFTEAGALLNESGSRGLIIAGHDAERLVVALNEIEPSGGTIVAVTTPMRPDLLELTNHYNRNVFRRLLASPSVWSMQHVSVNSPAAVSRCVQREIEQATSHDAPVLLFPFGPKSVILAAAAELADTYARSAWFVYPIPVSYDADYSYGVGETLWLSL